MLPPAPAARPTGPAAPAPGRLTVEREPGRVRLLVRPPRNLPVAAFLCLWLAGWAYGEVTVAGLILTRPIAPETAFLMLWWGLWTAGGFLALRAVAHSLGGHEEIAVDGESLTLRRAAGPLGRTRRLPVSELAGLRATGTATSREANRSRWMGALVVERKGRPIWFAAGLEGDEVTRALTALTERAPRLAAPGATKPGAPRVEAPEDDRPPG